jgi:hypothetical protein
MFGHLYDLEKYSLGLSKHSKLFILLHLFFQIDLYIFIESLLLFTFETLKPHS